MKHAKPTSIAALDIETAITHNLQGVGVVYSCPACLGIRNTAEEKCCRRKLQPLVIMETHADILLGIDCVPTLLNTPGVN